MLGVPRLIAERASTLEITSTFLANLLVSKTNDHPPSRPDEKQKTRKATRSESTGHPYSFNESRTRSEFKGQQGLSAQNWL